MADVNLKILLLGDSSVGKTSILLRYVDSKFQDAQMSTFGIEYKMKTIEINNRNVILRIWDTSGQERYRSITKNFYRNTNGIAYVFDITNRGSFENIKRWLIDSQELDDKVKKILVGNKIDLENDRKIDKQIIEKFAEKKGMKYYETSAKEGTNIDTVFKELAEEILANINTNDEEIEESFINNNGCNKEIFNISEQFKSNRKKKICCNVNNTVS